MQSNSIQISIAFIILLVASAVTDIQLYLKPEIACSQDFAWILTGKYVVAIIVGSYFAFIVSIKPKEKRSKN